jgi:hypothetical protein
MKNQKRPSLKKRFHKIDINQEWGGCEKILQKLEDIFCSTPHEKN